MCFIFTLSVNLEREREREITARETRSVPKVSRYFLGLPLVTYVENKKTSSSFLKTVRFDERKGFPDDGEAIKGNDRVV